ncbi:amidohydrolase family protein [Candidatus Hydrogenedentota bacterium]
MKSEIYNSLLDHISTFEIIDAHEHLMPEAERIKLHVDVFTLFHHYTQGDLRSAGMAQDDIQRLHDHSLPLEERWALFEPFYEEIKFGSYARPAHIAAREFCGVDEIGAHTCHSISDKLAANNTEGLYNRLLRQKCHIRKAICIQRANVSVPDEILVCLTPMFNFSCPQSWALLEEWSEAAGIEVNSLDDFLAAMRRTIEIGMERGDVGLKMKCHPYGDPDRSTAEDVFARLKDKGELTANELYGLWNYTTDEVLKMAREFDRVVALHAGVWGDFRKLDATHMIPIIQRHPEVKFDIFHASMPYVREVGFMAKNFPNVYLNLCWSHIVSPMMTRATLNEWMDYVPVNKIIAFGADYGIPVEKVYGHLVMARENIAFVLAGRVEEGLMSEENAVKIARKWFFSNPGRLYGIDTD